MLIFTPFIETKEWLQAIRPDNYNFYEFNLSSYYEYGTSLKRLAPTMESMSDYLANGLIESHEFDIEYGNYILNNEFLTFMSIVLPLYDDPYSCVIIYIHRSPLRDVIMECIEKLIQDRYGYGSFIINEPEDVYFIEDNASFSVRGIVNIQNDCQRAVLMGYYGPIKIPEEI